MEFIYKNVGFRLYCEMYIDGEYINQTEINGKDEKLYLISLYLNEKYKLELTEYAKEHCKIACRCFIDNVWFDAKSCSDLKGVYLINGVGQIVINQNNGYVLNEILKRCGYRLEMIRNRVLIKKERDYYGKN